MKETIKNISIAGLALFFILLNRSLVDANDPPPVASGVAINGTDTSITLTENTTTNIIVTATVTDDNGCADITGVTVKFYKTATGAGAADDENNHYTVTTADEPVTIVQNTCVGLVATYTAIIPVWYYADPAEWTAQVTPTDGVTGTVSTDTISIDTLKALSVTGTIVYGELALNADTGTTDKTTTVTNTGNASIGVAVDGYGAENGDGKSMMCTHGSILLEKEKYSKTASIAYADKTVLTDTAATITDFTISQRTTTATTGDIYWGFGLPINGVGGSCSGTVVFTAI
jgi:hypothetical protein